MEAGVRAGLRVQFSDKTIITQVKDSDDVSYRHCVRQGLMSKNWSNHNFAIAAKNSPSDTQDMLITDLDIDYLHIANLRPWEMPSAE